MPHVPPHLVTPTYVELRTGGEYLYCAIHRTFHGSDDFTRDQSRLAARYCIKCTPNEKANVDTLANMVPSAAGILEGRLRCGDSGAKATVQSDGERSKRAQKRGTDAGEEEAAAPRRAAKPKPRRSKRGKPLRTAKPRPKTAAARLRHQWTRRAGTVRVKWTVRRAGGAVDLPLCTTLAAQAATLERLRADGILREARPRKLHRTHGLVEYITDVTLLPEPGKFVCGQAAMMSGFGLELTELGIEVWAPSSRPCENLLSFAGMNRLCAAASGIGTALLLRKPLVRVTSQRQVLQRDHGVFIITGFHVPGAENDFEQLLSYSLEVMGLRYAPHTPTEPNAPYPAPTHTPPPHAGFAYGGRGQTSLSGARASSASLTRRPTSTWSCTRMGSSTGTRCTRSRRWVRSSLSTSRRTVAASTTMTRRPTT